MCQISCRTLDPDRSWFAGCVNKPIKFDLKLTHEESKSDLSGVSRPAANEYAARKGEAAENEREDVLSRGSQEDACNE